MKLLRTHRGRRYVADVGCTKTSTKYARGDEHGGMYIGTINDCQLPPDGIGLGWVHWHNTGRLHGYLGDIPPAEFEAAF
jgi:putative transposase